MATEQKIEEKSALSPETETATETPSAEKPVAEKPEKVPEQQAEQVKPLERSTGDQEIAKPTAKPKIAASSQVRLKDMQRMSRQNQIKMLCELAFQEGLDEAIKTAKSLDNAYVLDEFHDTLVDELYQRLVAENQLKKL